ncbi:hypothetical protein MANES_10G109626v8 [Manihot esculenta]|uniref:Uncharacterized protein n=1 Tax=Manihot esculenta TaxID=3983 RepID=A0ACB7H0A8_MANES|nr:hypothetical protein MANES_10G109626v8 [Manihot esculenta]
MLSSSPISLPQSNGRNLISFNSNQFPLKLSTQNYPTWRAQVLHVLRGHNLMGYVDKSLPPPPAFTQVGEENTTKEIANPDYEFWVCQDQLILAAIIASTNFSAMHVLSSATTLAHAWKKLKNIAEDLALSDNPVSSVDLIVYVLNDIGLEFRDIAAAI